LTISLDYNHSNLETIALDLDETLQSDLQLNLHHTIFNFCTSSSTTILVLNCTVQKYEKNQKYKKYNDFFSKISIVKSKLHGSTKDFCTKH